MTPLYFDHAFNQFDDATYGTLEKVIITLSGGVHSDLTYTNVHPTNTASLSAAASVDYLLFDDTNSTSLLAFTATTPALLLTAGPGASATASLDGSDSQSLVIDGQTNAAGLVPFLGTGQFTYRVETNEGSGSGGNGNFDLSYLTTGSWDVTIEYQFGTSAVPEPSSMALMGLGCMALTVYRRFSRKHAQQVS